MSLFKAAGDILGGKKESQGYKKAQEMFAELGKEAGVAQKMADPFSEYRGGLASRLNKIITGEEDFRTDPGYQFRLSEAMRETERGAAARGFNQSGNIMAAMNQRAQDVASNEYQNIIGRLTELAGAGSQNAVAGAQIYGDLKTASTQGMAGARIGRGLSQSNTIGSAFGSLQGAVEGFSSGGMKGLFTGMGG